MIFDFNPLHNFISPVTGKLPIETNYVLIGDRNGISISSPILIDLRLDLIDLRRDFNELLTSNFVLNFPSDQLPNAQSLSLLANGFMYNTDGIISTTSTIPITSLPNLSFTNIWIGNVLNRPSESPTIFLNNLPDLTSGNIWRGNSSDRPEESEDLSDLESTVDFMRFVTIPLIQADVIAIQGQLLLIDGALAALTASVTSLQTQVFVLASEIGDLRSDLNLLTIRVDNLRLNNIPADGDVSFYNFKLINLADPINPTDGVNLRTLISYINNVPTTIELTGDVTGSGNTGTPIPTTLQLTLDQIKIAQNTVNLNNQKISNLKSDQVEQQDALNAKFLWDLIHDQVEVVWQ